MSVLDKIREVKIPKPSEQVVKQLKELIINGELRAGDTLPGERELAARFGLGRGYIREAIKTFELYGIFKSIPGRGTIVSDLSVASYNEFLNNMIQFGINDYLELLDIRAILEPASAYRAALHATDEELSDIGRGLREVKERMDSGILDLENECRFHLEIANAAHNRFLSLTMNTILPDLTRMGHEINVLRDNRFLLSHKEHEDIYNALVQRDPEAAQRAMQYHMEQSEKQFSYCLRLLQPEGTAMGE